MLSKNFPTSSDGRGLTISSVSPGSLYVEIQLNAPCVYSSLNHWVLEKKTPNGCSLNRSFRKMNNGPVKMAYFDHFVYLKRGYYQYTVSKVIFRPVCFFALLTLENGVFAPSNEFTQTQLCVWYIHFLITRFLFHDFPFISLETLFASLASNLEKSKDWRTKYIRAY